MILKTEKREVELRPTTRKIVRITEENKCKNLNEYFFSVLSEKDIKGLATIIFSFAEPVGESKGLANLNDTYDLIDDLRIENNKSYEDLLKDIGEFINDMGFFNKKMTKEELKRMMNDPLVGFDMKKIINSSTEKAVTEVVANEFRGYKA
jgi:hypothetical protein